MNKRALADASAFDVIDELVVLDEQISVADFTELFEEKMDFWEKLLRERYGHDRILWRHWSDSSALRYRSAVDANEKLIVYQVSEGRIVLNGFAKSTVSVKQRVSIARKLLFEKRLFVSAQCQHTSGMLANLKPGRNQAQAVDRTSPHKHIFDALTYVLASESPMDVERRIRPTVSHKTTSVPFA